MRKIQQAHKCKNYTPNFNLNLTCKKSKRCVIYYEAYCLTYEEKKPCQK